MPRGSGDSSTAVGGPGAQGVAAAGSGSVTIWRGSQLRGTQDSPALALSKPWAPSQPQAWGSHRDPTPPAAFHVWMWKVAQCRLPSVAVSWEREHNSCQANA